MSRLSQVLVFIAAILTTTANAQVDTPTGHQGSIEWLKVANQDNQFYMVQRTTRRLKLTPNESFFPKLGLKSEGKTPWPGSRTDLNQNKNFQSIGKWDSGDVAEWGLLFEKPGQLEIAIHIHASSKDRQYTAHLGTASFTFIVPQSNNGNAKIVTWSTRIEKPGRHSLLLRCDKDTAKSKTRFEFIEISGPAAKGAGVLRKRWRPKAAHTRFSSSKNPEGVQLWIVEMDAAPGRLDFYAPMTTPFGYYGPTWLADGRVNESINFSLWSFKRGAKEPAIEKLSHLLAIGNPKASFGGFDHEGTGVKVRNWKPFSGRQSQKQTLALRVEYGETYDTYFSYFFDSRQKKWEFFASGNKLKAKRKRNFYPGSFVEVPGRAHVQRTGAYERRMRYRGWVVDNKGTLHPLDRMSYGDIDKETNLTYTDRGVDQDGRFFLQTGGWVFRKKNAQKFASLPANTKTSKVDFLDPDDLKFLATIPCSIESTSVKRRAKTIEINFDIRNRNKNAEVIVYWGYAEGLTFSKRWSHSINLSQPKEGRNRIMLKNVDLKKKVYIRLFLKNSLGQFWSAATKASD